MYRSVLSLTGGLVLAQAAWAVELAGGPITLRDAYFGEGQQDDRATLPMVGWYVTEGGHGFLLDRSRPVALLRHASDPEVWALRPRPAAGGGVDLYDDTGQLVVRLSAMGGVTLFSADHPHGSPAMLDTTRTAEQMTTRSGLVLMQVLQSTAQQLAHALRRPMAIRIEHVPAGSDAAFAEAVTVVARAVQASGLGVHQIILRPAETAGLSRRGGVLIVDVNWRKGAAGRPSSRFRLAWRHV